MTEKGFQEFEKKLLPKLESLPEIDKDTIYFDGIKKIEDKIRDIFKKYPSSRIVVFIDDLDRCSPETALEVFESVKVFLDIDGFIFIIGLSREALDKLIKAKYEKMGLLNIGGEEYVRKIIQIDINLRQWKDYAIKELIGKLSNKLDNTYSKRVADNEELIEQLVELNPRQTKRFINIFVTALSANPSLEPEKFLINEVLRKRWNEVYEHLNDSNFISQLKNYLELPQEEEKKLLQEVEERQKQLTDI